MDPKPFKSSSEHRHHLVCPSVSLVYCKNALRVVISTDNGSKELSCIYTFIGLQELAVVVVIVAAVNVADAMAVAVANAVSCC